MDFTWYSMSWRWVILPSSISSLSDWESFHSTWQSTVCVCVCLSSGIPHTTSFLIKNIQQVWYSWFEIGAAPKFFWADSRTLYTPHTTGRSDKQLYLGLSEVENSDQNRPVYLVFSPQLSPHSSKYLLQCSAEETNSYRFGITVWVNDEGI